MTKKNDKSDSIKKSHPDSMGISDSLFQENRNEEDIEQETFSGSAEIYDHAIKEHLIADTSDIQWLRLNNKRQMIWIFNHLISNRVEIQIRIKGEKTTFSSKFIHLEKDDILSETDTNYTLIIEKLSSMKANTQIQSLPEINVEFLFNKNLCRCALGYVGINNDPPYFGIVLNFPESIEIKEKRREERFTYETPEFVLVEFKLAKDSKNDKSYELGVINCAKYGIGMIVTPKDFDLLELLHKGDKLEDISFFASWTMIKVNGIISHITKIEDGKNKGCYIIGIESNDIIESCNPAK